MHISLVNCCCEGGKSGKKKYLTVRMVHGLKDKKMHSTLDYLQYNTAEKKLLLFVQKFFACWKKYGERKRG